MKLDGLGKEIPLSRKVQMLFPKVQFKVQNCPQSAKVNGKRNGYWEIVSGNS